MKKKEGKAVYYMLVVGLVLGILIGINLPQSIQVVQNTKTYIENSSSAELPIAGVDNEGNGVIGTVVVEVKKGTGTVSFDVGESLKGLSAQASALNAVNAAESYLNIDSSDYDINFVVKANASLIDGPSAGAAMAIGTILAFQNKSAAEGVAITGSIEDNGQITPVGSVMEKALAAKNAGITTFLVPEGESINADIQRAKECNKVNGFRVCRIRYTTEDVNIGESLGINVVEVSSIMEALPYFE